MAINLSRKDLSKVDQRFAMKSLSKAFFGAKIDFTGVKTCRIYNLTTQPYGDYTRSGSDRYGTPTDVADTVVEYIMTQDKSFSSVIDKGDNKQQTIMNKTGEYMKAQQDEQEVPMIDSYGFATLLASAVDAGQVPTPAPLTKANAYESFLAINEYLDDNEVPQSGRVCAMTASAYNFMKQDPAFIKDSEKGQGMLINGQIGTVDGVKIVKVPSSRMPANTAMIITHPSANAMPKQIAEVKVHKDAPGISGVLIEGRQLYDAFTFVNKKVACAAWKTAV